MKKSLLLLDESEKKFGYNTEVEFWRKYYRYVFLGEKDFTDECVKLTKLDENVVPYFYLINVYQGKKFLDKGASLRIEVKDGSTEKKRYIKSMLEKYLL